MHAQGGPSSQQKLLWTAHLQIILNVFQARSVLCLWCLNVAELIRNDAVCQGCAELGCVILLKLIKEVGSRVEQELRIYVMQSSVRSVNQSQNTETE